MNAHPGAALAIADPPYLGRAQRWYGAGGRASGGGLHRADEHPDAAEWDTPARHERLVRELHERFDGWAIAAAPSSLATYLPLLPEGTRTLIWHKTNAVPSAHRVRWSWEPVFVYAPPARRLHGAGIPINDVLVAPFERRGFAGAKPTAWTRWVLDALGHTDQDTVTDVFAGSGAVAAATAQGVLL